MIHPILKMGDPRLLEVAQPVTAFNTPELDALINDLIDTMRAANGAVITDKEQVGFDNFKNRYIIGDPAFAIEQLRLYREAVNPTEVVCWMHLPGISGADAMRSVELFAREVMPHFK